MGVVGTRQTAQCACVGLFGMEKKKSKKVLCKNLVL